MVHAISLALDRMYETLGATSVAAALIFTHPVTSRHFVRAPQTHGAASVIEKVVRIHCILIIHTRVRNRLHICITRILNHLSSAHNHIHCHIHIHHQCLFISFKLFNIPMVSRLQNPKLQKHFHLLSQKFKKIHLQLVVPVATSYPHIVLIEGVGGSQTLEIGDLGGDLGEFGIANEDGRMFGGGGALLVVGYAHSSVARGPLKGSGVLCSLV